MPMTYAEFLETTSPEDIFTGLSYTKEEQDRLFDWFATRRVCSDRLFLRAFRRLLKQVEGNYRAGSRIESIEYDPLVQNYTEHETNSITEGRRVVSGEDVEDYSHDDVNHNNTVTNYGQNIVTYHTQDTTSDSNTNTSTESKSQTKTDSEGSTDTELSQDSTQRGGSLAGALPQSQTYGDDPGQFPLLNWAYTSSQTEQQTTGNSKGKNHSATKATSESNVLQTGSMSVVDHNLTTSVGEDTQKHSGQDSVIGTGGASGTSNRKSERSETSRDDGTSRTREITAGRGEAPQDLLTRAFKYATNTDAFQWLCEQLEPAFFQLHDYGGDTYGDYFFG